MTQLEVITAVVAGIDTAFVLACWVLTKWMKQQIERQMNALWQSHFDVSDDVFKVKTKTMNLDSRVSSLEKAQQN